MQQTLREFYILRELRTPEENVGLVFEHHSSWGLDFETFAALFMFYTTDRPSELVREAYYLAWYDIYRILVNEGSIDLDEPDIATYHVGDLNPPPPKRRRCCGF